jgi:AcrR family transcriptional regulator
VRTKTELRGEILAAARAEFAQYGLAGARIDRIARAASASKERLYAHFGDKETLFRDVVATDGAEFFRAVQLRPDAVPEFVGGIFDLAQSRPEHIRMITWAQLEGFPLEKPEFDGEHPPDAAIAALAQAQADGHVDRAWDPQHLLVLLLAIGLGWAHFPDPASATADAKVLARRRAAAVEAAARIVKPARGA